MSDGAPMAAPTSRESDRVSYVAEAAKSPFHWVAVAGVVAAGAVGAVTGLWIPFAAAAGLEALYLGVVPRSSAFRRRIDERCDRAAHEAKVARVTSTVETLGLAQRGKYVGMCALVDQIRASFASADPETRAVSQESLDKLESLADGYLGMLVANHNYERLLKAVNRKELDDEADLLKLEVQTVGERIREVKARRLEIVEARRAQLDRACENREILRTQLATVEDVLKMLNESSLTLRDPRDLNGEVGRLAEGIDLSQAAIREVDDFLT